MPHRVKGLVGGALGQRVLDLAGKVLDVPGGYFMGKCGVLAAVVFC